MFGILKVCNENIETKLNIFDAYVSSVFDKVFEIWGFHPAKEIERVYTIFCRRF